jgi:hypothetical protein
VFCPNCRLEYRPGFNECSDCRVPLVESLPEVEDPSIPRDTQGRELLWSGISRPLYRAIAAALDARRIAHTDVDKEFGILPTMVQAATLVWIDPRNRMAAHQALAEVLEKDPSATSASDEIELESVSVDPFGLNRRAFNRADGAAHEDASQTSEGVEAQDDGSDEDVPDDIVEDFDTDEATIEVWSGEDEEMARTFEDCLNNVGIGCVVDEGGGKWRVLVLPSSEKRAREIVREITEASAPE